MKIGRNQACHCGSGKKYKHCCFKTDSSNPNTKMTSPFQNSKTVDTHYLQTMTPAQFFSSEGRSFQSQLNFQSYLKNKVNPHLSLTVIREGHIAIIFAYSENKKDRDHSLIINKDGTFSIIPSENKPEVVMSIVYLLLHQEKWPREVFHKNWDTCMKALLGFLDIPKGVNLKKIHVRSPELTALFTPHRNIFAETSDHRNSPRPTRTLNDNRNKMVRVPLDEKAFEKLYIWKESGSRQDYWWQDAHMIPPLFADENKNESCLFEFTDGTILTLADTLLHDFAICIPTLFWPVTNDISKKDHGSHEYWNKSELFYFNYLKRILSTNIEKSTPVELRVSPSRMDNEFSVELSKWIDVSPKNEQWQIGNNTLQVHLANLPELVWLDDEYAFDKNHEVIYHFSIGEILIKHRGSYLNYSAGKWDQDNTFIIPLVQNNNFDLEQLVDFRQKILMRGAHFEEIKIKDIDSTQIHLSVDTSSQDSNRIKIGFTRDEKYSEIAIPYSFAKILAGIKDGLSGTVGIPPVELANYSNKMKRQHELRFLKHSGLYMALCLELLVQKRNLQENKKLKITQVKKEVENKIFLIYKTAANILDDSANQKNLSDFITANVRKIFTSFIDEFLDNDFLRYQYITSNGIFYRLDFENKRLDLLQMIIEWITDEDHYKSLLKQSIAKGTEIIFEKDFSCIHLASSNLSKPLFNSYLRKLKTPEAFKLRIDGKNIEALSSSDFDAKIEAVQTSGDESKWFDLNPKLFFKGELLSPQEASTLFLSDNFVFFRGQYYLLDTAEIPALKWLDYFWSRIENKKKKNRNYANSLIVAQDPCITFQLLAMRASGVPVSVGPEWEKVFVQFDRISKRVNGNFLPDDEIVVSKDLFHKLMPFQLTGVQWMIDLYQLSLGGLLADDMGLGKTAQAIHFLRWLKSGSSLAPSLIIVPTSLLYNWANEFKKFAPEINITFFNSSFKKDGIPSQTEVIILSYGLLVEHSDFFIEREWNVAIFDEAQNLKNITAKRTSIARSLKTKVRFCLSGTPLENHFGEFFSLIDLVMPSVLGSYNDFMKIYNFKDEARLKIMERDVEFLKLQTNPLVLRRLKSFVLPELPDKTESIIELEFEAEQKQIYRDIAISYNEMVLEKVSKKDTDGEKTAQLAMLTAILRLRQACSHPEGIPNITYSKVPPKIEALAHALQELKAEGQTAIVFTNFKTTLFFLEKFLKEQGHEVYKLHGEMTLKQRIKELERFDNTQGAGVMLLTLKVGGVGLNLTRANYVFHLEPWWNPASENQATDRIHRLGQKQHVQVYRYILRDSLEQKMQDLKQTKWKAFQGLFEIESDVDMIQSTTFAKKGLSYHDFQHLITD